MLTLFDALLKHILAKLSVWRQPLRPLRW